MHIRTNIELSYIQIIILAICPLFVCVYSLESAIYLALITIACYLISAFVCFVFNKYMGNSIKIFVTAFLSAFVVTLLNLLIEENGFLGLKASNNYYFAIISAIIMSTDNVYIETKASVNNFFIKIFRSMLAFACILIGFGVIKEFLAFGTIFNKKLFAYSGYEFFATIVFDYVFMGLVCAIAEFVYRKILNKINEKEMVYAKLVKKIRNEKKFQYDMLRRNKLLESDIEENVIGDEEADDIIQKENENEEVVPEEEVAMEEKEKPKNKRKKKRKKVKVSKDVKKELDAELENTKGEGKKWLVPFWII